MFTESMLESIRKVEATRAQRMGMEPRRMSAQEKDELLKAYHPDYRPDGFKEIKIGPKHIKWTPLIRGRLSNVNPELGFIRV